jgi:hypothetical protein
MGVKISELNEASSVQNSDVLPIVQNGETKKIQVETLGSQKVNKSGDTLTGSLYFNNADGYDAIRKKRTIDGVDYELSVGLGANKSARLELNTGGQSLAYVEARTDGGIYNGKTGKKLAEEVGDVSLTTTLEGGRATAYRIGNVVIVNIYGPKKLPSDWTDYDLVTLNGVTAKNVNNAPIVDQNTGLCADISIAQNSNVIKINKRGASSITGSWLRGQLIFVAN